MERDRSSTEYLPTEAEIREACQAIQDRWPEREERERRLWSVAPAVSVAETVFYPVNAEVNHE